MSAPDGGCSRHQVLSGRTQFPSWSGRENASQCVRTGELTPDCLFDQAEPERQVTKLCIPAARIIVVQIATRLGFQGYRFCQQKGRGRRCRRSRQRYQREIPRFGLRAMGDATFAPLDRKSRIAAGTAGSVWPGSLSRKGAAMANGWHKPASPVEYIVPCDIFLVCLYSRREANQRPLSDRSEDGGRCNKKQLL